MDDFDQFWIANPTVSLGQAWGDFAGAVLGLQADNAENKVSGFSFVPTYLPGAPTVVAYYEVVDVFGGMASSPQLRGARFTRVSGKDPGAPLRTAMQGHNRFFGQSAAGRGSYNQSVANFVSSRAMSDFERLEAYVPFIFNGQVVIDRFQLLHARDAFGSGSPVYLLTANIVSAKLMQQQNGGGTGPPH
jgi:hypothetical protein